MWKRQRTSWMLRLWSHTTKQPTSIFPISLRSPSCPRSSKWLLRKTGREIGRTPMCCNGRADGPRGVAMVGRWVFHTRALDHVIRDCSSLLLCPCLWFHFWPLCLLLVVGSDVDKHWWLMSYGHKQTYAVYGEWLITDGGLLMVMIDDWWFMIDWWWRCG